MQNLIPVLLPSFVKHLALSVFSPPFVYHSYIVPVSVLYPFLLIFFILKISYRRVQILRVNFNKSHIVILPQIGKA